MSIRRTFLSSVLALILLVGSASGAIVYYEGWDAGSVAGWMPNTIQTTVAVVNAGGNPNGYLYSETDSAGGTWDIGATTELAIASGDYAAAGVNLVSFDVMPIVGAPDAIWFRVRYLNSTFNGWHFPLPGPYPMGVWTSYSIPFDPTWSDAEAMGAGWIQEDPGLSFGQTMAAVYHPEVRISGVGPLDAGIDNFQLSGEDQVQGVAVDIKPTSCPNPFLLKPDGSIVDEHGSRRFEVQTAAVAPNEKAVLPVAILGSENFDVADIDPESVMLSGVPALRWAIEDVAGPVSDSAEECECTEAGPDGYMDLTLKFNRAAIAATLGAVSDGDFVELVLTGLLTNGDEFEGSDCILIRLKGQGSLDGIIEEPVMESYPNPFNAAATIRYTLEEAGDVNLSVFNVLGQRVATLVDGFQPAGSHSASWVANSAPSGMYFYRLQTSSAVVTRQMTLLK